MSSIQIVFLSLVGVVVLLLMLAFVLSPIIKRWTESGDSQQQTRGQPWNWGKILKWLWWAIVLAAIVWGVYSCNSGIARENVRLQERSAELARALHEEKTQIKPEKILVASWVTEDGNSVQGKSASGPMPARVNEQTETSVWISVRYEEFGTHQTTANLLQRDADGMWRGTWAQEKPKRGGTLVMELIAPDHWSGTMTDGVGNRFRYNIKPVIDRTL